MQAAEQAHPGYGGQGPRVHKICVLAFGTQLVLNHLNDTDQDGSWNTKEWTACETAAQTEMNCQHMLWICKHGVVELSYDRNVK